MSAIMCSMLEYNVRTDWNVICPRRPLSFEARPIDVSVHSRLSIVEHDDCLRDLHSC